MKMPSSRALMLNGFAVALIAAAVITQVRSFLFKPELSACAQRYDFGIGLALARGNAVVAPADIQAAADGTDAGVMENLSIRRVADAPLPLAFGVALAAGSMHPDHSKETKGGVTFPWRPRSLPPSGAACLTYDINLPADFDFGPGSGTLPGLSATGPNIGAPTPEKLSVLFGWTDKGVPRLRSVLTSDKPPVHDSVWSDKPLPRGRWVRVDLEVILNTEGEADGSLRFWLDGALVAEKKDVQLRHRGDAALDGVLVDVHFGASRTAADGRAAKDEQVLVTPFELRWN